MEHQMEKQIEHDETGGMYYVTRLALACWL